MANEKYKVTRFFTILFLLLIIIECLVSFHFTPNYVFVSLFVF